MEASKGTVLAVLTWLSILAAAYLIAVSRTDRELASAAVVAENDAEGRLAGLGLSVDVGTAPSATTSDVRSVVDAELSPWLRPFVPVPSAPEFLGPAPLRTLCNPETRHCDCLLATKILLNASLCEDAAGFASRPRVDMHVVGWLARHRRATAGRHLCVKTNCLVTVGPRVPPTATVVLQSVLGRDVPPWNKTTLAAGERAIDAALYLESFDWYPTQIAPPPQQHDVYISYHPERTPQMHATYVDYSQAQLLIPPMDFRKKSGLLAWMASNCRRQASTWPRTEYVAELMKFMRVDAYGACLHNTNVSVTLPQCVVPRTGRTLYVESECIMHHYKFYLALENSESDFYVTEKLYQPLAMGAVPVYIGAPNVRDFAPAGSYIDARAFGSPQALATFLLRLASDEDAYTRYLAWKAARPPASQLSAGLSAGVHAALNASFARLVCKLCDHAHAAAGG